MTNTNFTINDLSFDVLFSNGRCLTYKSKLSIDAFLYSKKLEEEYYKEHKQKAQTQTLAILESDTASQDFHYFTNGILIHNLEETNNNLLKRVLKLLEIRKLPVTKIYSLSKIYNFIDAENYMKSLEKYAREFYSYKEDITIAQPQPVEDFVKECFANNNILLTASKDENFTSDDRETFALFADGRFYYTSETNSSDLQIKKQILRNEHKDLIFLDSKPLNKSEFNALYEEAKKHAWYISKEEQIQQNTPPSSEIEEMNKYIENIFSTNKCLSVTNIIISKKTDFHISYSPDIDKFALFSNGLLLISNKHPKSQYWIDDLKTIYKDLELKIELVPDYYITAIYTSLPKYQRSAKEIYMEMLKEKAKKLKKELNIPHHAALDIIARHTKGHFKDFNSIKINSEALARFLIADLKFATISNETYLDEYQKYLKTKENKLK